MSLDYRNCLLSICESINDNSLFVDVGCNINPIVESKKPVVENWNDDFTSIVLEYFPRVRCVGIEPLHYQSYEEKWKDDERVTLFKIALSDNEGVEKLYYPGSRHVLTSFYLQNNFNNTEEDINSIDIECRTLDNICREYDISFIDYLKLDVEGAEFKILKGSEKLIQDKKIKYIQFEIGLYDDDMPKYNDICNFLKFYGYNEILSSNREKLWGRV